MLSKRGTVARIYLPPDANCLLSVADHCLRSRNYVNLIVIDKQPQLQWLDMDDGHRALRARRVDLGVGEQRRRRRAGRRAGLRRRHPDAGDGGRGLVAARARARSCKVRVVNVVDLMTLFPPRVHPHGMNETRFVELFTADKPVVFAFHGYQRAIHEIVHGRAERRALPRARLQRAGHDHHAVRHGRAERDEPLPPGGRGAPPRPRLRETAHRQLIAECEALIADGRRLRARALRGPARDPRLGVDATEHEICDGRDPDPP